MPAVNTVYRAIKTTKALEYLQDMVITGNTLEILGFSVSSQFGELNPDRTLADLKPVWYPTQGEYVDFSVTPENVGTKLSLIVTLPPAITNNEVYITELYIHARYKGEIFLFGICQTQTTPPFYRYIPNTEYTQGISFDLTQWKENLNIIVNPGTSFSVKAPVATSNGSISLDYDDSLTLDSEYRLKVNPEGVSKDKYNLITSGSDEKLFTDGSKILQTNQITNCITEIPQRIKYTLGAGTLTIKAGSVVIVPYGIEDLTATFPVGSTFLNDNFKVYDTQFADGKFFVWVELVNDLIRTGFGSASEDGLLYIAPNNIIIGYNGIGFTSYHYSGETAPTQSGSIWYDTANNLVKSNASGSWIGGLTLPIGSLSRVDGVAYTVNKIFQGYTPLGNCTFIDKGIKYLFANGKNENETLKNIEVSTNKITILDNSNSTSTSDFILLAQYVNGEINHHFYWNRAVFIQNTIPDISDVLLYSAILWYRPDENKWLYLPINSTIPYLWSEIPTVIFGKVFRGGTTEHKEFIQTNNTVDLLKRSDAPEISGWSMPSSKYVDLTLGVSGTTYTAPANGWFNFGGGSTSGNKYAEMSNNGLITGGITISGIRNIDLILPVKKGDIIGITYTTNTSNLLRFFYAEGEI